MIPSPIQRSMKSGYFDYCPTCSIEIPGVGEYRVCMECAEEPPIFNVNDDKKIVVRTPNIKLPTAAERLTARNLARLDSTNRVAVNAEFLSERRERKPVYQSDKRDDNDNDNNKRARNGTGFLKVRMRGLRIGPR